MHEHWGNQSSLLLLIRSIIFLRRFSQTGTGVGVGTVVDGVTTVVDGITTLGDGVTTAKRVRKKDVY